MLSATRCSAGCIGWIRCATGSSISRGDCIIRCGWRTARLTSTTICTECRCPARVGAESSMRSSEKSRPPRWIAAVRCGSFTSPKAWPDTNSQSSGSCTMPWPTGSRRRIYWPESWTCQGRCKTSATMTRRAHRPRPQSCCGPRGEIMRSSPLRCQGCSPTHFLAYGGFGGAPANAASTRILPGCCTRHRHS